MVGNISGGAGLILASCYQTPPLMNFNSSRLERDLYSRKDKEGIEIREWLKADIRLVLMLSFQYPFLWDGSSLVLLGSWDEL